jgi:hypothetical protein
VPITGRKRGQEVFEPLEVDRPARWQLIQHGAEVRSELAHVLEKAQQRGLRILQLLHVRQEAARFDGIQKPARRLFAPLREGARLRQPVEAVVDLDRIEAEGVMAEPARLRKIGRIEVAPPVRVLPTGTADPDLLSEASGSGRPRFTAEHPKSCYTICLQARTGPLESIAGSHPKNIGPLGSGLIVVPVSGVPFCA